MLCLDRDAVSKNTNICLYVWTIMTINQSTSTNDALCLIGFKMIAERFYMNVKDQLGDESP